MPHLVFSFKPLLKFKRYCFRGGSLLLCLSVGALVAGAQDGFEVLASLSKSCKGKEDCMLSKSLQLLESDQCAEREAAACVILTLDPSRRPAVDRAMMGCNDQFWMLHHVLGNLEYKSGNWEQAIVQFDQANREGMEPKGVAEANLGATYFAMKEWLMAMECMEAAWATIVPENVQLRYMVLNNLAAIYLKFEAPEEAMVWIELAKSNLEEIKRGAHDAKLPASFIGEASSIIAMNEFSARLALRDTAFIERHWRDLNWGVGELDEQWFKLLVMTSELLDSREFDDIQARNIFGFASDFGPDGRRHGQAFDVHSLLIDYAASPGANTDGVRELLRILNAFEAAERAAYESVLEHTSSLRPDTKWAIGGLALGLVVTFVVQFSLTRQRRRQKQQAVSDSIQALQDWMQKRLTNKNAIHALNEIGTSLQTRSPLWERDEAKGLNASEQLVLDSIRKGESPKDLAVRTGWTPKYVYAMRSKLRSVFNVPSDASLDDWINNRSND